MQPCHLDKISKLNRIEGQIKGIKKMIEDHRYCVDLLIQLKAVTAAIKRVEQDILKDHIQGCLKNAVSSGEASEIQAKIDEVMELLKKRI